MRVVFELIIKAKQLGNSLALLSVILVIPVATQPQFCSTKAVYREDTSGCLNSALATCRGSGDGKYGCNFPEL
jgi:hypothetical protein